MPFFLNACDSVDFTTIIRFIYFFTRFSLSFHQNSSMQNSIFIFFLNFLVCGRKQWFNSRKVSTHFAGYPSGHYYLNGFHLAPQVLSHHAASLRRETPLQNFFIFISWLCFWCLLCRLVLFFVASLLCRTV